MGGDKRVKSRRGPSYEDPAAMEVQATKRRTEITIETQRVLMINRRRVSAVAWCDGCGWQVRMIKPDEAAVWAGLSTRTIYRWIEARQLHFVEGTEGSLLICLRSLSEIIATKAQHGDGRTTDGIS